MHFIEKIKEHSATNGQTEFLVKWQNFSHSESTGKLEEHISHNEVTECYFKESLANDANDCANVEIDRNITTV